MNITPRKRTKIVSLCQHTSMTVRDIAAAVGVVKSSVSRIIDEQKNLVALSPKRKSKRGRKCKTKSRTDKFLVQNSTIHPYKTSRDLQRELLATNVNVDSSIVQRRLIEAGRFARKPIQKTVINTCNEEKTFGLGQEISVLDCIRLEEDCIQRRNVIFCARVSTKICQTMWWRTHQGITSYSNR
ncbi:HTH_Tnp_Tc3_2 domain-containing protein [Trichonephila clavipes]|nr:HTH_Tnp_Tc3_2 domain-containing protein [Trichonephila clavipes]